MKELHASLLSLAEELEKKINLYDNLDRERQNLEAQWQSFERKKQDPGSLTTILNGIFKLTVAAALIIASLGYAHRAGFHDLL